MFLRVNLRKGIIRVLKTKKLSLCFVGPFQILKHVGSMAYNLALPPPLLKLHDLFHVSQLNTYTLNLFQPISHEIMEMMPDLSFETKLA